MYRGRLAERMPTDMAATDKTNDLGGLEKSLEELEALVARLESGDLPLEQALKEFEHGVKLTRQCQAALQEAEQKVEILLKKTADGRAEPVRRPATEERTLIRGDRSRSSQRLRRDALQALDQRAQEHLVEAQLARRRRLLEQRRAHAHERQRADAP